jgi:predicted PurR-regulated permease PerM
LDRPTSSGRTLVLLLVTVAIIWFGAHLITTFIVLFAAILLATAVDQPVSWLQRHGVPRAAGVLGIYALLLVVAAGLVAAHIPLLNVELLTLREDLPGYAASLERDLQRIVPTASQGSGLSFASIANQLAGHAGSFASRLTTVTVTVGRTLLLFVATIAIAYFLAVDPTAGTRLLARFLPAPMQDRVHEIGAAVRLRIGGWARGQAIVAFTYGITMGLGLWILGIPYAASLGVIAAVLEVVPYLGGAVTLILAVLMALTVGLPQVLSVIVLYSLLVVFESHVLSPLLLGHAVGLPPVAVLIALLAGFELLGLIGALLAVPACVVVWAIIEECLPTEAAPTSDAVQAVTVSRDREPPEGTAS